MRIQDSRKASAALTDDIKKLNAGLEAEIAVSSGAAKSTKEFELRMRALKDGTVESVKELEKFVKLTQTDTDWKKAWSIKDQNVSPLEKFKADLAEVDRLLKGDKITKALFGREVKRLSEAFIGGAGLTELGKFFSPDAKAFGSQAARSFEIEAQDRARDPAAKDMAEKLREAIQKEAEKDRVNAGVLTDKIIGVIRDAFNQPQPARF